MTLRPDRTSYDEVPYSGLAYPQTHPDRLATVSSLLGIRPPDGPAFRYLEVGCTDGGNLIPLALAFPDATFVGIDLSSVQVAAGQRVVEELGLRNISLRHMNLLEVGPDFGAFDYVVAHGIYSWVPPEVRDGLLRVCRQNLAPQGVAYVSYNAYPGWHLLDPVRSLLLYRLRDVRDPDERLATARALLDELTRHVVVTNPIRGLLPLSATVVADRLLGLSDASLRAVLLHDILEEHNQPVYFRDFVEHAGRHGLQYLAEANFAAVMPGDLEPWAAGLARSMATTGLDFEQHLDYMRGQTFRQTLVVHEGVAIERRLSQRLIWGLSVSSQASPDGDFDLAPDVVVAFRGAGPLALKIDTPVSKAAMWVLHEAWPRALAFGDLLGQASDIVARAGLPPLAPDEAADMLAADLLTGYCYGADILNLHRLPPQVPPALSERPAASPLVRLQAARGGPLTSLQHENISADALTLALLPLVDGTRDAAALAGALRAMRDSGALPADEDAVPADADAEVGRLLRWAYRSGLLVA